MKKRVVWIFFFVAFGVLCGILLAFTGVSLFKPSIRELALIVFLLVILFIHTIGDKLLRRLIKRSGMQESGGKIAFVAIIITFFIVGFILAALIP